MKKNDLIAGKHVLELKNGEKYFVCGNYLLCESEGFMRLDSYNDNLGFDEDLFDEYTVMRVYSITRELIFDVIMGNKNLELVWERKIKVTDFERMILKEIEDKYKYIARDKDDSLYVYNQEPFKTEDIWEIEEYEMGVSKMGDLTIFSHLFPMVRHSDEEPTLISDLLEGCD